MGMGMTINKCAPLRHVLIACAMSKVTGFSAQVFFSFLSTAYQLYLQALYPLTIITLDSLFKHLSTS